MKKGVYFPGFNGVRCLAACGVVVRHIEQYKQFFGFENISNNLIIASLGEQGVSLFFVLSGFLITYLLLVEGKEEKRISIKKFYIRRAMRILPLYFLIVILGFFVVPTLSSHLPFKTGQTLGLYAAQLSEHFSTKLLLYLAMLPNLCLILFPPVLVASQAWSIGVEEQFYLLWPWLIRFCEKNFVKALIFILALKIAIIQGLRAYLPTIPSAEGDLIYRLRVIYTFTTEFKVECLALGALGAILCFRYPANVQRFLVHRLIQVPAALLLIFLLGSGFLIPFSEWLFPIFYTVLLINISQSSGTFFNLEGRSLNFLGKISYGIYMYHPICIVISLFLLESIGTFSEGGLYVGSFILTFGIAALSYLKFENFFLKLKQDFAVSSGMRV